MNSQRIHNLLKKFNLKLDLTNAVLNIEISAEYDSYEIIQRTLSFINSNGQMDYGNFDCYHFGLKCMFYREIFKT